MVYRFEQFEADDAEFRFTAGGAPVQLEPKTLRLLLYLLANRNRLIRKQELLDAVWGDSFVTENALTRAIGLLRKALNDDSREPRFIETVPTAGYRFIAEVSASDGLPPQTSNESTVVEPTALDSRQVNRRTFVWGIGVAAVTVAGAWFGRSWRRTAPPGPIHVMIPLLEGAASADPGRLLGAPMVAPDGSAVVVSLKTSDGDYLFKRRLDSNQLARMDGTHGGSFPFWSPDSQHIGFFADGKLKRIPVIGGSVMVLCDAPDPRGGSWSSRGVILFGMNTHTLFQVVESGGAVAAVTQLDSGAGENSHRYPCFLPDGNRFLYFARADNLDKRAIYLESLDHRGPRRRVLVADGQFAVGRGAESGEQYLLTQQAGKIVAQSFDIDRGEVSGPQHILLDRGGQFSVSDTGVLVLRTEQQDLTGLVWLDRAGREIGSLGAPTDYWVVALSFDGRFAGVIKHDYLSGQFKVWIASLPQGLLEPFSDSNHATTLSWSHDSSTIYYTDFREGKLFRRKVQPRGAEELAGEIGTEARIRDISPNGRSMVGEFIRNAAHSEIMWSDFDEGSWHGMAVSGSMGLMPSFSPDGKWLAVSTNQTGDSQIYVMDFPNGSLQRRISMDGGYQPRWRKDGKELFFVAGDGTLMSVEIAMNGKELRAGAPKPLFHASLRRGSEGPLYDATSDGQRFLVIEGENQSAESMIEMVLNWPSLLGR